MNNIDKYIKAAKELVIKPEKNGIEDKILKRISSIREEDKNLLDAGYLDFLKKSNSRLYQFTESVLNHPGKFAFILISIALFAGLSAIILKNFLKDSNRKR
jgi:hypothetical protein